MAATFVGGFVAYWRVRAANRSSIAAMKQAHVATQGYVVSQMKEAVEGLGSDNLGVRIGALWTLERIAREHRDERESITVAITDYLQTNFRRKSSIRQKLNNRPNVPNIPQELFVAGKALQALFSISRANLIIKDVDFSGLDFSGGEVGRIHFVQCVFDRCDFTNTKFNGTHFRRCSIGAARFHQAQFFHVRLRESPISFCDFRGVRFEEFIGNRFEAHSVNFDSARAKLCAFNGVDFKECKFTNIQVIDAFNFDGCVLTHCDFTGSELRAHWLIRKTRVNKSIVDEETKKTISTKISDIFK